MTDPVPGLAVTPQRKLPGAVPGTNPGLNTILDGLKMDSLSQRHFNSLLSGGLDPVTASQRYGPRINLDLGHTRNPIGLFFQSALSSAGPELFGATPNRDIERFRAENPIGGFFSHLLGFAPFVVAPSLGPVKLLSAGIPGFTKAMTTARTLSEAGSLFRGQALAEFTRFAPIEAATVAGSFFVDEPGATKRTLQRAGSELLAFPVLGGVGARVAGLKGKGTSALRIKSSTNQNAMEFRVATHIGEAFDRVAPVQSKWNFVNQYIKQTDLSQSPIRGDLESLLPLYENNVKFGIAGKNPGTNTTRYVANLGNSAGTRRVESLYAEGVAGARGAKGILAKMFKVNEKGETLGFATGEEATASEAGWLEVAEAAGVKDIWQAITQFPRELVGSSQASKDRLLAILRQDFRKVGENSWLAKEAAEGLTIGVKRLSRGPEGNFLERAAARIDPTSGRFYIFKTNTPSKWFKDAAAIYDTNAAIYTRGLSTWGRIEKVADTDVPTLTNMERLWSLLKPTNSALFTGKTRFSTDPNVSAEAGRMRLGFQRFLPQRLKDATDEIFRVTGETGNALRSVTAATRFMGAKNPRLSALLWLSKTHFEEQMARATDLILGPIKKEFLTGPQKPLAALFRGAINPASRRTGGTQALFKQHLNTPEALRDFNRIRLTQLTPDEAAKAAKLHPEAITLARKLDSIDELITREIAATARALGMEETLIPAAGHMALSRSWFGPFRVPLYDAVNPGKIRGFASGYSPQQAGDMAIALTESVNKKSAAAGGEKLLQTYSFKAGAADRVTSQEITHAGAEQLEKGLLGVEALEKDLGIAGLGSSATHATDLSASQADIFGFAVKIDLGHPTVGKVSQAQTELFLREPFRFKKSKKFLGARGTEGVPFTLKELQTTHSAGIIESYRYLARNVQALGPMREQLSILTTESSVDAIRFNRVFNSFNGIQGPTSKAIDRAVDTVLADFVGPGAAMRSVRRVNEAMFLLTLGSMDLGFAALNMSTPIMTALPEMSFLLKAPPEYLQKYYSPVFFGMPSGGFRQGSFLDMFRFSKVATQDILRPDKGTKEALQRAVEEHVIGRDFVETVHGGLRQLAEGEGGIMAGIQRFGESMVAFSEESSRAYSFALARRVGKDFFLLNDEQAFQFGRQFVQNTMYGYGVADRPRMLTGALGSGFGLFKTWTQNYVGNLARYTGEASRGNFQPLAWAFAGAGAIGGTTAMPLAGMADGFARLFGDKEINDLIYDWVGNDPTDHTKPWAADFMAHGFPSLLGMTLRSRAAAPSAHLQTDLSMYTNLAMLSRATALKDALGSFATEALEGRAPFADPKFQRELILAFAPRTLQRASTSFAEQGVLSLRTGNTLLPALSMMEGVLNSVGLTPIKVANTFEVQQQLRRKADRLRADIQSHGARLSDAMLNGDHDEVGRVIRDAMDSGVNLSSVSRSAQARMSKQLEPFLSRQHQDAVARSMLSTRGLP